MLKEAIAEQLHPLILLAMEDHHQRLGPIASQEPLQGIPHRLLLLMPIRQVGQQLRNRSGTDGGAGAAAAGASATAGAAAGALRQFAQGSFHQGGEMVGIAEALHGEPAIADALQEGVLPLAVLPLH